MNGLIPLHVFLIPTSIKRKNLWSGAFVVLSLFFIQNFCIAEGSVNFKDYPGKRMFYWANEEQQIKVFVNEGEFINIGASHIGVNGGYMMIYKPDGSFAGIYQDLGVGAGLGIINNDVEELNGPTGGGTSNGSGYIPVVQPVAAGEGGVWTVVFSFSDIISSSSSFAFDNLENNQAWDRATHQPDKWAVVSWDVTVSTTAAANDGGTMMTGRVYTNQYKAIITGNGNTTSPSFLMMSKEGIQYQLDLNEIDPYGFDFFANSVGIVNHNGVPTYTSKSTSDYEVSEDIEDWTPGDFYIYDPQSRDSGLFVTYKIFFNTPDSNMPTEAMTTNIYTGDTYTTWLYNSISNDPLEIQGFELKGLDDMAEPNCFGNNFQEQGEGVVNFNSNINGTAKLSLDFNNDGDFDDAEDRILYKNTTVGSNQIEWDGEDGMGNLLALADGFEINYLLELRAGELHVMARDIENNAGGITFTRLNGENAPASDFYFDHTELGGSTSGGAAPSVTSTSTPYIYDSNWGNNKMLDYWTYQDFAGSESGKWTINIVNDCTKPIIVDSDLDGVLDNVDLDDDNDGIPDALEYCHAVGGGFACFDNSIDPSADEDGDLVANYLDADDAMVNNLCADLDGNGVCDNVPAIYDNDQDGVPDHLDLDSDNDGIPDMVEAGHGQADMDQDARIDGVPNDFGDNGLYNNISNDSDASTATILYPILDTDNNMLPDHDDLDADDDGLFDVIEAPQADGDLNGQVGTGSPKVDENGLPFEDGDGNPTFITFDPKDLDEDDIPDYRDWDRDNDGIADYYECPDQADCIDSDDDGNFDIDEEDSDGDGLTDMQECPGGIPCLDADANMIDDFREVLICPSFNAPVVTATDDILCEGEVLGLSTDDIGGTGVAYEWFFDNGTTNFSLGITTTPNYFVNFTNPTHTGNYSVMIRAGACTSPLSNPTNVKVYSTSSPVAENITSQAIPACQGESIQLSVPSMEDATYEWFGPDGFNATVHNPIVSFVDSDNAGSYYAIVTLSEGCATLISTNTTLYVQSTPAASAVEEVAPTCEGSDVILTANPLGVPPSASLSFEWFYQNGNTLGTTTSTEFTIPNISAGEAGEYYVVMTVGNCTAPPSEMVQVTVTATDVSVAGNDLSICGLGNTNLNATMPAVGTGRWTSPTGAVIIDENNPQSEAVNLSEGANVFVWSLSNGTCLNYSTDTIVVNYSNPTNDIAFAGADVGVCDGTEAVLTAGSPTASFGVWTQPSTQSSAGVTISNNTSTTPTIEGMVPGNNYVFTWTLSEGTCLNYDADQVMIMVSETPNLNAFVTEEEKYSCGSDEISLEAMPPTIGTAQWRTTSTASIVDPNNAITIVDDLEVGASTFIWELSNGACVNYNSDTVVVYREETIEVADDEYVMSLNGRLESEDLLVNDIIGFINEYSITIVEEPTQGTIEMVDGIFTYVPRTNAFGIDEFVYEICNVNCPGDCKKATATITINGLDEQGDCWIPNVLTPNGNGKNDALIIPCTEQFTDNELLVFNRWGDKVFSVKGYKNDWEATYKGKELPAGTYFYIFKLDTNDDNPKQGFLTIVR